jgi:hypothetical protein
MPSGSREGNEVLPEPRLQWRPCRWLAGADKQRLLAEFNALLCGKEAAGCGAMLEMRESDSSLPAIHAGELSGERLSPRCRPSAPCRVPRAGGATGG